MKEISLENLGKFEDIFNVDREKHMVILLTIKTFIYRFKKYPELKNKAKLYALTENWIYDGNFFMTFSRIESEQYVYFDSVNDSMDVLKNALKSLDYTLATCLFSIRNEFFGIVYELRDELNLKLDIDADTVCFHLPIIDALSFEYEIPENIHAGKLSDKHAAKINSLWPHRAEGSEDFVSFSIKYHLNVGLFDKDDNLVAWCLRYDNGSLAILQTDESYQRKGLGSVAVKMLSKEIATECKCDVISLVVHENIKSTSLFTKLGFKKLGSHTWINLIK